MKLSRFLIGVVLGMSVLLCPGLVSGTDIPIFPTGGVFKIQPPLTWGVSTQPGFNNNFFFTPINLNESVCVYVYNNNTTSAHSFSVAISTNGNPGNTTPSDGTWVGYPNIATQTVNAAPSVPAVFGTQVTGAALVAINLSASTVQAGSPETANVVIIQMPSGACPSNSAPFSPIQFNPLNAENIAVNGAVVVTTSGVSGFRSIVYSVSARCSAGTASITITQGGTTIWSSGPTEVGTTTFRFQWSPGLTLTSGSQLQITLSTCGAANTGTLDTQTSFIIQQ